MKAVLTSAAAPTFTPGAANAGTLNFSTAVASYGFAFGRLLGIINLTQNTILYTAGVSGYGGSWASGTSILTLAQATTGNSSTDVLEVIWDDPKPYVSIEAPNPAATGGWPSMYHLVVAASTNTASVKASAGTLGGIVFSQYGNGGYIAVLKIYDKASAPTLASDTPKLSIPSFALGANPGVVIIPPAGLKFSNGIAIAVTAGTSDSDATAVSAGAFIVNLFYS